MITIPKVKLAADSADALAQKRAQLREALLKGKQISIGEGGNVVNTEGGKANIFVPKGKLAAGHMAAWFERDPVLLEAEKAAMAQAFPNFQLEQLDDGRLCWTGALNIGLMGGNQWHVMAVYDNCHGMKDAVIGMGGTVRVYLVEPDINDLIAQLGWQPHHLLIDSNNNLYLCTTEAQYVKNNKREVTSAASTLAWAVKWLMCFELVLTGDMTTEEFDKPHGI